ncbi:alpha-L-fucosidase [Mucilaginibacter sp. RS28]|uniref:alpha-L-fucosidase n=1 Tax=Mucilaginibacter straminoryzae TaxID=2932774 RepID=A0A9X2B820_9SPHI|nr:alpha-L-fucosidase [Mucilaginibacter straminoryzae]MCJ8209011.1 alpha-L-fucosidase [Mucilaginibacter straminoryzae]
MKVSKKIASSLLVLSIATSTMGQSNNEPNKGKKTIKYTASWESLEQYDCPEWFRDAKFGIWAHWGPQSVPELGDWYGHFLYKAPNEANEWRIKGGIKANAYHLKTYGHPSKFGYKDLIPLFKAEHWDPKALMELYYKAGARYFMSMGQHHDNFDMWDSKYQPWNAVNMGPKKDIVKGWQEAAKALQMKFGVSFHGSSSWSWFEPSRGADLDGPLKGVPYDGNLTKADGKGLWWEGYDPQDLYCKPHQPGAPPDSAFKLKFLNRVYDLVDNYKPDLIYFDGGFPFKDLRIAAHFYNKSQEWNNGRNMAVINVKGYSPEKQKSFVHDIENGQSDTIRRYPWQTDTSFDGWFISRDAYTASTKQILQQLADIVSKNGNLMLNITQKSDGTISEKAVQFLKEMAAWMDINGESIHGTRPWKIFGEGPTNVVNGEANKTQRLKYTSEDIRFTTKTNCLYAILMEWPDSKVTIKSLQKGKTLWFGDIKEVTLLGSSEKLSWSQNNNGLTVSLPQTPDSKLVRVLKISGQ